MTDLMPPRSSDDPGAVGSTAANGRRRFTIALGVLIVAAIGGAAALAVVSSVRPHLYTGTVLQGDEPAPSLAELSYGDGTSVDLDAFDDEVVLVFFGYTNCPDVCPTTMADAAGAIELLGDGDAERTNLVMVSVDPDRDDAAKVGEYVGFFDPGFRGATGPVDAIDRAASAYGVFYQLNEPEADGSYLVDHTGTLMGIGPDGSVRVIWSSGVGPEALAADIAALLS
ncbi:MAG: SCO family protein [Actinomycetota bacterium]